MAVMASQITSLTTVYSTVYSVANQRKHQSSASLACVRGIPRWPVNTPHKGPVMRKMFPFDDVIVLCSVCWTIWNSHKSCKAIVLCPSIIFLKSFHSLLMEYSLYCIVNPSIVFCVHVKMHWISNRDVGFLILQDYASHVPKHLLIEADGRIYASGKLTIIGSDNGLSPTRRQAIIWTNAGILLIGPSGTNFSEIFIGIQTFSVKKMHLKMSYARSCSFCLGLNMLNFCIFILNILQFCCCLIYWR